MSLMTKGFRHAERYVNGRMFEISAVFRFWYFPSCRKVCLRNSVPCYLFHMKATPLNFWILLYNDFEFFNLICESLIMWTLLVVRNTHLHMSMRKRACSASVAIGILNLTTAPCILCL